MTREKFITRTIRLIDDRRLDTAIVALQHAPIDPDKPIECVLREEQKARKLDQNALMWVGPLKDISEQAWLPDPETGESRRYSDVCWHEMFKRLYLPEDDDPRLAELAKENYRKWDITPKGDRVLVGSTTQLTVKGFAEYLTQVEAEGASIGVMFHASPRERAA